MGEHNGNTPHAEVSRLIIAAWINFAYNLDPNGPGGGYCIRHLIEWTFKPSHP